jgi:hypothetical protein
VWGALPAIRGCADTEYTIVCTSDETSWSARRRQKSRCKSNSILLRAQGANLRNHWGTAGKQTNRKIVPSHGGALGCFENSPTPCHQGPAASRGSAPGSPKVTTRKGSFLNPCLLHATTETQSKGHMIQCAPEGRIKSVAKRGVSS